MANAKSLLHIDSEMFSSHSADVDNTVSQETRIMITCQWTLVRFEYNGRTTCLHCSSNEGNTHFQPRGLTR